MQIGYFAQNQAQLLDENLSVFETIDNVARGDIRLRIKDILAAFMFRGDDIDKRVKVLSGGERSRLAMIRLLLEPVNLLILDEPTNHLDMPSKDVLKEAIKAFEGTAIIVSHDRDFLDGLVTKVFEFGNGRVTEHILGDAIPSQRRGAAIEAVLRKIDGAGLGSFPAQDAPKQAAGSSRSENTDVKRDAASFSYAERKAQMKQRNKAAKAVKDCEQKIASMEKRIAELNSLLSDPANASDMTLVTEYISIQRTLDAENERWMMLAEELERMELTGL